MEQKTLADRFKGTYGGNAKGITSLAAMLKRTRSALASVQSSFAVDRHDAAILQDAMAILSRLGREADAAKSEVKRHVAEKAKLRQRLMKESAKAVTEAFQNIGRLEDALVLLECKHKLLHHFPSSIPDIESEMAFDSRRHGPYRQPNVVREINNRVEYFIRELIDSVVFEAMSGKRSVAEIVAEAKAEFEVKRPEVQQRLEAFIRNVKAVAVAQRITQTGADTVAK